MNKKSVSSLSLRKLILSALVAAPLATLPSPLWALPQTGANVSSSAGTATIITGDTPGSKVLNISTPDRTVLTWKEFGSGNSTIASGDTVNYALPSASAAVLNRVVGTNGNNPALTLIDGALISTGKIFIINPAGITVSTSGTITASGVALSSVNESDFTFSATGALSLAGTATGDITNQGNITVGNGNTVSLAGQNVYVSGKIDAGTLTIAGGNVTLAKTAALTVGAAGNNTTSTPGYGNVSIATNGGAVDVVGSANNVTINGANLTINTTNSSTNQAGSVSQTGSANTITLGNGIDQANLSITANGSAGNGTVTISKLAGVSTLANSSVKTQVNVTLNSGTASVTQAQGDLKLNASTITSTASPALSLTTTVGNITSGGNTTINGTGATIALSATGNSGNATINYAGVGDLTFSAISAGTGKNAKVTLTSTSGNVTLPAITTKSLNVKAAGDIAQTGALVVNAGDSTFDSGNKTVLTNAGNDFQNIILKNAPAGASVVVSKSVSLKDGTNATGDVTVSAPNGAITVGTGSSDVVTIAGNVSLTAGGSTALSAVSVSTAGTGYTTAPTVAITGGGGNGATATSTLSLVSTGLTISGGTGYAVNDVITFTGGTGTQATAKVTSVDGTGAITGFSLTSAGTYTAVPTGITTSGAGVNATVGGISGQVSGITLTAPGTGYTSVPTVTLTGTNTTPAVASATVLFGNVGEATNNFVVNGKVTASATGAVLLAGANQNGVGVANQFGQVNITAAPGGATVFEQTTLNLGNITTSNLNAYSATSIMNSGQLVVGNVTVGAGTASAPGDIALDFAGAAVGQGNQIAGTIFVNTDLGLLNTNQVGNYLAKSLTVVNENTTKLVVPASIYGSGMTGNITVTETSTGGVQNVDTTAANAIVTSGNLNLNLKTGAVNLNNSNNAFNAVTVTSGGDVTALNGAGPFTVNATLTEASNAGKVANFTSGDALTIGSFTSNYTGAAGVVFTSGNKKAITDSVAGISVYGPVTFASAGAVTVTKAGHSFGGVTITTGNNSAASLVESGTLKVVKVATGKGAISLTSTNGDIITDAASAGETGSGSASFSASQGSITLSDAANNNLSGNVSITASGNTTIAQNQNLVLANVKVGNGTFKADVSGVANKSISQASGSTIYTYGATTFAAAGSGNITVDNTGNRFGGLTLTTGTGNVTVRELTTMNLQQVNATALVATDEGADIIDSGSGAITTQSATFNAKNNITLGLAGTDLKTAAFTAGGNVSILDQNDLVLGASTIGGTFRVTDATTTASLSQTGALVISGDTTLSLTGANSAINLSNSANQFGALQFFVGSNGAIIAEATTMNLKAGSIASGPVTLSTGGNFITSGTGSSSFLYSTGALGTSLQISAVGTITPGTGSLTVVNGLTVFSNNTKDLSGLSFAGNLYSKHPIYLGTGTNIKPPDEP